MKDKAAGAGPARVVIVGGVAGGASAAARLRRLLEDASIVVFERGPYASFANCGLPYYLGGEIDSRKRLLVAGEMQLGGWLNLDVRTNTEVLSIDRDAKSVAVRDLKSGREYSEPYDYLVLSPGAAPIRPEPLLEKVGPNHPRVPSLRNIPDVDRIKQFVDSGVDRAVVVGGGFIGIEVAEQLVRRGVAVTLIEMLPQVMPPMDPEMVAPVHQALVDKGVDLRLGKGVVAVEPAGEDRLCVAVEGGERVEAGLVVMAIGVRPESRLAQQAGLACNERGAIVVDRFMRTDDPAILAVGDAVEVFDPVLGGKTQIPLAGPANRQGRLAADVIAGAAADNGGHPEPAPYRGTQGTSIVRAFDVTVGATGASEKALRRAGRKLHSDFEVVYVHPAQHAGYYPGATRLSLKLIFERPTGRVLGASAVGADGVDKRIDVLAMAIQMGATVFDLEQAELAYAPPFGSAKDAVNMAGFQAANALRGGTTFVTPPELARRRDDEETMTLLDVRTKTEFQAGALGGSINVPLDKLRARLDEVPPDKPVVVYCGVGLRGYLAERILRQRGYADVVNLAGGFATWQHFFGPIRPKTNGPESTPSGQSAPAAENTACGCGQASTESEHGGTKMASPEIIDVRGLQCPGPLLAVAERMDACAAGTQFRVLASDPGFPPDVEAWCRKQGHPAPHVERNDGHVEVLLTAAAVRPEAAPAEISCSQATTEQTQVVFSGDLDRVLASFVIATAGAAMGNKVTMFFTFWGLNALRKDNPPRVRKGLLDRMFGWMMPRGAGRLTLSKMHMGGMGTAMMKYVMKSKNVESLPELIDRARQQGIRMVACTMSMDVMGLKQEELIDGLEFAGAGTYLGAADRSKINLFV